MVFGYLWRKRGKEEMLDSKGFEEDNRSLEAGDIEVVARLGRD